MLIVGKLVQPRVKRDVGSRKRDGGALVRDGHALSIDTVSYGGPVNFVPGDSALVPKVALLMPPDQTLGRTCSSVPWYRARRFRHFDLPLSEADARSLCENPSRVARHAFWPFIGFEIRERRFKTGPTGIRAPQWKSRSIRVPAHADAHVMAYYAHLLRDRMEAYYCAKPKVGEAVLAYRQLGRSNAHFAADVFRHVARLGSCVVLCYDLESFFDSIDHALLKQRWCDALGVVALPEDHYRVFKAMTRYAWMSKPEVLQRFPTGSGQRLCEPRDFRASVKELVQVNTGSKGIPQGSPLSAVLSNVFMREFDASLDIACATHAAVYRRYSDDIVLVVPLSEADGLAKHLEHEIEAHRLRVSVEKTERSEFVASHEGVVSCVGSTRRDGAMQYLGFTFDGERVLLRGSSRARFDRRLLRRARAERRSALAEGRPVSKKKLLQRYSHLGRRNFVRYALSSARVLNSPDVRRQLRRAWNRLVQLSSLRPGV